MINNDSLIKRSRYSILISALLIFLITFLVYTPALKNEFVWDDFPYVSENTLIQSLDLHSLFVILTSLYASNWHPLTWYSHALDYFIWDLNPFGHHLTNIVLHGLNTSLVFLLFTGLMVRHRADTQSLLPSHVPRSTRLNSYLVASITALLFGLHPLHVESVVWVAERKDLLCAFFFLLSIFSYISYTLSAVTPSRWMWFTTSILMFLSALMSKPMAVTLPCILLLLDYFPLKRLKSFRSINSKVILEKTPFFVLSAASSIVTIIAQQKGGAIKSLEHVPMSFRMVNALHSIVFYLRKVFFPFDLSPYYPMPHSFSSLELVSCPMNNLYN